MSDDLTRWVSGWTYEPIPHYSEVAVVMRNEYDALAARLHEVERELVTMKASCALAAKDAVQFQDERDALKKDAERYRWLRKQNSFTKFSIADFDSDPDTVLRVPGDEADTAIDAAMSADSAEGNKHD